MTEQAALHTVAINGLTLTGGDTSRAGGAIFASENLTVTDSMITGNATTSGEIAGGGGIYSRAFPGPANTLTVRNSFITDNDGGKLRRRRHSQAVRPTHRRREHDQRQQCLGSGRGHLGGRRQCECADFQQYRQ